MKNEDNRSVIQGLYAAVNVKDFEYIKTLGHEKSEWFDIPFNSTATGASSVVASWEKRITIFPDVTYEIKNLIATDSYVIVQGIERGTHNGTLKLYEKEVEPKGTAIEVGFCDVYYLESGKILKANSNFDVCSLLRQLAA